MTALQAWTGASWEPTQQPDGGFRSPHFHTIFVDEQRGVSVVPANVSRFEWTGQAWSSVGPLGTLSVPGSAGPLRRKLVFDRRRGVAILATAMAQRWSSTFGVIFTELVGTTWSTPVPVVLPGLLSPLHEWATEALYDSASEQVMILSRLSPPKAWLWDGSTITPIDSPVRRGGRLETFSVASDRNRRHTYLAQAESTPDQGIRWKHTNGMANTGTR